MPERVEDPAARYLDLLKQCLTRAVFQDDVVTYVPEKALGRKVLAAVSKVLARKQLSLVQRAPYNPALREDGRDWPPSAETMVGLKRLDNLQHCIEVVLADGVPGDILEAGVWRGGASILARGVLAAHGDKERTVWVADSFEGLPPPDPKYAADEGDQHHTQPFLAVGVDAVKANFERYGLLDDRVRFLQGWFSDTLPGAPIEQLSVLRADGDMYGSTIDILASLYPKVSPGGFVIIDDYGAIPACKAAVDDFRRDHGITELMETIDWTGVYWRVEG